MSNAFIQALLMDDPDVSGGGGPGGPGDDGTWSDPPVSGDGEPPAPGTIPSGMVYGCESPETGNRAEYTLVQNFGQGSGDELFLDEATPYGAGIRIDPALLPRTGAEIYKTFTEGLSQYLSFKFVLNSHSGVTSGGINIGPSYSSQLFKLIFSRGTSSDAQKRPFLSVRQDTASAWTDTQLGTTQPTIGQWYVFSLDLSAGTCAWSISTADTDVLWASGTIAGTWSVLPLAKWGFDNSASVSLASTTVAALRFCGLTQACVGDDDWTDVALALNFEGANNSSVLTDSSTYADNKTITANASVSTTYSKFGGASLKLIQTEADIPTWSGTKFNSVAGEGATIEFWFKPTARYNGTVAPAFFRVIDATTSTAYIEMGLYALANEITIRFEQAPSDFRRYAYTPDADGWTHAAVCVGAAGGARVYLNQTLVVSRPNSEVFATGAYGNPTTGCVVSVGRFGGTSGAALTCYMDGFRYTRKDKYADGVPEFTLPYCNGPTGSTPTVPISGTEALTGLSMTVVDGDVNSPGGSVALTGKAMTASTGNIALFSASKTAALVGQSMSTFNVARMTPAEYPFLRSGTVTTSVPYLGTPVVFVLRFNSDGSVTQQINGGAITPFFVDTWAYPADGRPNATTTMIPVTAVPNAFKQTFSINKVTAAYTATLAANSSMAAGCTFTFTARASGASYYDYVAIVPTAINPKYGQFGYTSLFYLTFNT